jgi:hypothetical protein
MDRWQEKTSHRTGGRDSESLREGFNRITVPSTTEIQAYYEPESGKFYVPTSDGRRWVRIGAQDVNTYLKKHGVSDVMERRLAIQRSQSLIYAGPLSGRQRN